jgi:hypothetical protein
MHDISHMLIVNKCSLCIGIAGKELLDTYSAERQPVGLDVVTQ